VFKLSFQTIDLIETLNSTSKYREHWVESIVSSSFSIKINDNRQFEWSADTIVGYRPVVALLMLVATTVISAEDARKRQEAAESDKLRNIAEQRNVYAVRIDTSAIFRRHAEPVTYGETVGLCVEPGFARWNTSRSYTEPLDEWFELHWAVAFGKDAAFLLTNYGGLVCGRRQENPQSVS